MQLHFLLPTPYTLLTVFIPSVLSSRTQRDWISPISVDLLTRVFLRATAVSLSIRTLRLHVANNCLVGSNRSIPHLSRSNLDNEMLNGLNPARVPF